MHGILDDTNKNGYTFEINKQGNFSAHDEQMKFLKPYKLGYIFADLDGTQS